MQMKRKRKIYSFSFTQKKEGAPLFLLYRPILQD